MVTYVFPGYFHGRESEDVYGWLVNMEKYMQVLQIHEDWHSAMFGYQGLLDYALRWYLTLPKKVQDSWSLLKNALRDEFGRHNAYEKPALSMQLADDGVFHNYVMLDDVDSTNECDADDEEVSNFMTCFSFDDDRDTEEVEIDCHVDMVHGDEDGHLSLNEVLGDAFFDDDRYGYEEYTSYEKDAAIASLDVSSTMDIIGADYFEDVVDDGDDESPSSLDDVHLDYGIPSSGEMDASWNAYVNESPCKSECHDDCEHDEDAGELVDSMHVGLVVQESEIFDDVLDDALGDFMVVCEHDRTLKSSCDTSEIFDVVIDMLVEDAVQAVLMVTGLNREGPGGVEEDFGTVRDTMLMEMSSEMVCDVWHKDSLPCTVDEGSTIGDIQVYVSSLPGIDNDVKSVDGMQVHLHVSFMGDSMTVACKCPRDLGFYGLWDNHVQWHLLLVAYGFYVYVVQVCEALWYALQRCLLHWLVDPGIYGMFLLSSYGYGNFQRLELTLYSDLELVNGHDRDGHTRALGSLCFSWQGLCVWDGDLFEAMLAYFLHDDKPWDDEYFSGQSFRFCHDDVVVIEEHGEDAGMQIVFLCQRRCEGGKRGGRHGCVKIYEIWLCRMM